MTVAITNQVVAETPHKIECLSVAELSANISHAADGSAIIAIEEELHLDATPIAYTLVATSQIQPVAERTEAFVPASEPATHNSYPVHASRPSSSADAKWRLLSEKPLWIFFAKLREIHFTYPDDRQTACLYLDVKNELFNRYVPDVLKVVRNYFFKKMPKYSLVHQDELEESAQVEMWKYLDKYDPNFGTITFMQFFNAKRGSRLQGAIKDCLRSLQDCTREIAKQRREIKPMMKELAQKLGHKPTPEEFCDEYGWDSLGSSKQTYREIITDPLFTAGVFNQRLKTDSGSEGGMDESDLESLASQEAKPARNVNRMQGADFKQIVLSAINDEWIRFIVDCYIWQNDTDERICSYINACGKKCSVSWVAGKRKEGYKIIEAAFGLDYLRGLIHE